MRTFMAIGTFLITFFQFVIMLIEKINIPKGGRSNGK